MKIAHCHSRHSTINIHPYDEIQWANTDTSITDDGGKVIFEQRGVQAPASWSPLAIKIAVSKYFYGDISRGIDPRTGGRETSVRQLINRVVSAITREKLAGGRPSAPLSFLRIYDQVAGARKEGV